MKIFIVLAHPEHQSFNGAMFRTAVDTLSAAGHEIKASDLHAMQFDPVSGRHNFLSAKDPDYFKQQIEELAYAQRLKDLASATPVDVGIY